MPYPRYQGNNDYGRGDSRDDRRGGYNQNQSSSVSPWGSGGNNFNQGYGSNRLGPSSGPGALLPTPGNRGMGAAVDPMALVGNIMGAVGAMAQQNNPLATLANQLALAQAMQNKVGGNMGGVGDMGSDRGGVLDLRHDRSRPRHDMGHRTRDRSPIARRSSMGSRRSRSRDRRRSAGGRGPAPRDRSREKRAEHEIYIGNYPVRFRESDVRKLFEDHGINVTTIRLKHDGLKVFAFAETESLEMIEKAKNAMEGKEINGRKLRVRSSKDKSEREADRAKKKEAAEGNNRKRSRGTEREVGREDIKKYLVASFIDFMDREIDAAGEDAPGEYKGLMDAAKKALAAAYSLPEDDSFKVNKELEDIFLGSVRREIKLPELPKDDKNEEKETNCKSESKVDEDADDDGNWKRRKVAKDDEDEDDAIRKDEEEETGNEQDAEENDDDMENLDEVEADTTSAPEADDENEEVEENTVEDIKDEEINRAEDEDKQDNEENEPSEPSHQPTKGRGRGRGRSSRSSRK